MGIILYVVILLVYLVVPAPVQLVIFIGNLLLPDSVILVDELVMGFGLVKKINSAINIWEWICGHKILCIFITSIIAVLIVSLVVGGE